MDKVYFSTSNLQLVLKFDFQPSTMKPGNRHPTTIKTEQIWSFAGLKAVFYFSNNNKIRFNAKIVLNFAWNLITHRIKLFAFHSFT